MHHHNQHSNPDRHDDGTKLTLFVTHHCRHYSHSTVKSTNGKWCYRYGCVCIFIHFTICMPLSNLFMLLTPSDHLLAFGSCSGYGRSGAIPFDGTDVLPGRTSGQSSKTAMMECAHESVLRFLLISPLLPFVCPLPFSFSSSLL